MSSFRSPRVLSHLSPLSIALLAALAVPSGATLASSLQLDDVVVTATRSETQLEKVPATITAVDDKDIQKRAPLDETALFEGEPDMVISRDARRYGAATINIRGIEGNRVLQMVDGVRLPEVFTGGGSNNITTATTDSPELDFLHGVEVLRGPASSLYGSDALGGVVGYRTLNPEDLLIDGKEIAARYRSTWREADKSFQNTLITAAGNSQFKALAGLSYREGHELGNRGNAGGRSAARENPNDIDNEALASLVKLAWTPSDEHRLGLTFERRDLESDVDTQRFYRAVARMTSNLGTEKVERERWSLDWEWTPANALIDRFYVMGYHQDASNDTHTYQRRSPTSATCSAGSGAGNTCDMYLDVLLDQKAYGLSSQIEKAFDSGSIRHNLVAGLDWRQLEISQWKDATIFRNGNYANPIKVLIGETYPTNGFTPGKTHTYGLFLQDAIELLEGDLVVTPGVRYDRIELRPDNVPLTVAGNSYNGVSRNFEAVSPKLSAVWQFHPDVSVYAQYVRGFRAPNYNDVNGIFHNASQNYARIANPDLDPETSNGYEIGTRFNALGGHLQIALFRNDYKDFIESQIVCRNCTPGVTGSTYQHINFEEVTIRGAEIRGRWDLANDWYINSAIAYARGDAKTPNGEAPLNSVEPLRGSLALGWEGQLVEQNVGFETRLRAARGVSRVDESDDYYEPGGYGVVDLSTWWHPTKQVQVGLNLNNLFDRKYWIWSDIRQSDVTNAEQSVDFYSQPGRNLSASVQIDF